PAGLEAPFGGRGDLSLDGQDATVLVLAPFGTQPDRLFAPVVVAPLERSDLADAPGGKEEGDEVCDDGREVRAGAHGWVRRTAPLRPGARPDRGRVAIAGLA